MCRIDLRNVTCLIFVSVCQLSTDSLRLVTWLLRQLLPLLAQSGQCLTYVFFLVSFLHIDTWSLYLTSATLGFGAACKRLAIMIFRGIVDLIWQNSRFWVRILCSMWLPDFQCHKLGDFSSFSQNRSRDLTPPYYFMW
jgi:hypothetical protein